MSVYGGLVLFAGLQLISAQAPSWPAGIPVECQGPPPALKNPLECCEAPKIIEHEVFEECGYKNDPDAAVPPVDTPPIGCSKQYCVLSKYNLMKDESIDFDAFKIFLDEYAQANNEASDVIETIKGKCFDRALPGPPIQCEVDKLFFCISSNFFFNCPKWKQSSECETLTAHIEKCKPYFPGMTG